MNAVMLTCGTYDAAGEFAYRVVAADEGGVDRASAGRDPPAGTHGLCSARRRRRRGRDPSSTSSDAQRLSSTNPAASTAGPGDGGHPVPAPTSRRGVRDVDRIWVSGVRGVLLHSRLTSLTTHVVFSHAGIGAYRRHWPPVRQLCRRMACGRDTSRSRQRRHDLRVMPRGALGTARCSCPCLTAAGTSRTVNI